MAKGDREFFARCAAGFEDVLAQELVGLKMRKVRAQVGGVSFFGSTTKAYVCCLWSRVATRIQLVVGRVEAKNAEALYEGVCSLPWEDHVREGATLAVSAHGTNDELKNTAFTALKVKDAICDRLRAVRGSRPDIDGKDPDLSVNVAVHPRKATVYVNLSGPSLHRRGYRLEGVQSEAPLKETLAAGMLLTAGWPEVAAAGGALVDPMCGSGTLVIEAALMLSHGAPGILRTRWGFEGWAGHDKDAWARVVERAALEKDFDFGAPLIFAGDIDETVVELARANAGRAGVSHLISFYVDDAANLARHLKGVVRRVGTGLLVANPPYGERLLSDRDLPKVRQSLTQAVDCLPRTWTAATISPDEGIESALGREATTALACHNGPIPVTIKTFDLGAAPTSIEVVSLAGVQTRVRVRDAATAQFAARLRKAVRDRMRWAKREGVTCLRVYDADVPDYAFAIDLYEDVNGMRMAHLMEYPRPASVDERRALGRIFDAQQVVATIVGLDAADVICRPWERREAVERTKDTPRHLPLVVREAGITFEVDLFGKPDCGLPLDERGLRAKVAGLASKRRVAVAGGMAQATAVVAACAGASRVVAQESFPDRVSLIQASLARNGVSGKKCPVVCAETDVWLAGETRQHHAYDVVVLAPPVRARDAQATEKLEGLIRKATAILVTTGTLVVCWRTREGDGVRLPQVSGFARTDITDEVVQPDFVRSRSALRCVTYRRA